MEVDYMEQKKVEQNELQAYEKAVEYYATNRINKLIHNAGPDYAKIVLTSIFGQAGNNVKMVAGSLCNDIVNSDDYISAVTAFLQKPDARLQIILLDYHPEQENRFLQTICEKGNVDVFAAPIVFKRGGTPIHFCVADGSMYRIETDLENRKAEVNFNDSEIAGKLSSLFDSAMYDQNIHKRKIGSREVGA